MWSLFALIACTVPAHPTRSGEPLPGGGAGGGGDSGVVVETGDSATHETAADSAETGGSTETGGETDTVETAGETDTAPGDTAPEDTEGPTIETGPRPDRTGPIVIYAVRHAEKDSESEDDDPGLTEEGQARAEALAELMAPEPLTAIYATDLRRTQDTVQPTADDHGLPVVTDIDPEEDLANWILMNHDNEEILHCGHSYTLEDFFDALGATGYTDVDGYGQLWILTVDVDWTVTVEESTYGE